MNSMEKVLRGLGLKELEALINLCCTEGKRSQTYLEDHKYRDVTWTYDLMGVPIKFYYYKGICPNFRLSGDGWTISFKGAKQPIWDQTQYCVMQIGPMSSDNIAWCLAPTSEAFYVYGFRRRGNLDRFRHNLSLLRIML